MTTPTKPAKEATTPLPVLTDTSPPTVAEQIAELEQAINGCSHEMWLDKERDLRFASAILASLQRLKRVDDGVAMERAEEERGRRDWLTRSELRKQYEGLLKRLQEPA